LSPPRSTEQAFFDAIERLKQNRPNHPELQKRARLGTLFVNFSTVALEAGHSRTLIAHDGCPYPRVRAAIQGATEPAVEPRSAEAVIMKLRQENADLRRQIALGASQRAALLRRMRALEKAASREIRRAKRERAEPRPNPNIMIGRAFPPGSVVPFSGGDHDEQ